MITSRLALAALLLGLLLPRAVRAQEPQPILLWPAGAPGSEGKTAPESVRVNEFGEHIVSRVHRPSITPYLPDSAVATGAAVVVLPGGGHRELWMDHEGYRVGRWLAGHGIAAFVLKYRLAREDGSTYTIEDTSLSDVQRAIRYVRSHAAELGVAPERIGVMGFSAGGELAALAGFRYDSGAANAPDPVDRAGSRPAFMALIYPAIPAGLNPSAQTPPAFMLCGSDDSPGIVRGVQQLFTAISLAGGSAEVHVIAGVGHGFGIRDTNPPAVAAWIATFYDWLQARGMLGVPAAGAPLSPQMQGGIPGARPVPVYTPAQRAAAAQRALGLAALPVLGPSVPLTPDAPFAPGAGGARLSAWKPSFVLGRPGGGEIGFNFWGIHNEGHVNVGFTPAAAGTWLLDCRLLSAGAITWKVYAGPGETPRANGQARLVDGHILLPVQATVPGELLSVELWPTPVPEPMGFLGCDLGTATLP